MVGIVLASLLVASSGSQCNWPSIAAVLEARAEADQAARDVLVRDVHAAGANDIALQIDLQNRQWFRPILKACGWPEARVVGEPAANAAWLIAQHADMDPDFQLFAARLMKSKVLIHQADGELLALLVDRNARMQKQPQTYGMQYRQDDGVIRFLPIEDPAHLDDRRKEIGLVPFACRFRDVQSKNKGEIEWPEGVPRDSAPCTQ
ncbi:DUF6624 domain-containing protein [Dyella telluris]|uniref:Uncharacterized protein n=1 Tax=Dyella telluris TaxID=2763498 RepID=A0A7G8Q656_9GAMM|nr:DUF6624 domain-containing protein [Dyella telluris]QNK02264.1 hypothetical protein H8F01_03645 [Dyella telluris]